MPSPIQQNAVQEALANDKLIFSQESFRGGMNQQVDPTRIEQFEYPLLINGRTRYGVVEPTELPLNADPQGTISGRLIQGIISAGPYLVVFADGKAFVRNITVVGSAYNQILHFQHQKSH